MLRQHGHYLPHSSFSMRKRFLKQRLTEAETIANDDQTPPEGPNPMEAVGMMKQNIAGILPQLLLGGWVNYFFPGFILVKLPFQLPSRFKVMFQRGMPLQNLDVSYVTSLSWYFINLIGLRGLNTLILGQAAMISDPMLQQMRMQDASSMMAKQNTGKLLKQEQNELEITPVSSDPTIQINVVSFSWFVPSFLDSCCSLPSLFTARERDPGRCSVSGLGTETTECSSFCFSSLRPSQGFSFCFVLFPISVFCREGDVEWMWMWMWAVGWLDETDDFYFVSFSRESIGLNTLKIRSHNDR